MNTKLRLIICFIVGSTLWSCETTDSDISPLETPLVGTWKTVDFPVDGELQINQDSTFSVNLLVQSGIQATGSLIFEPGNKVTFINTSGSDLEASNPYPGVYTYNLSADTVRFTLVNDTLSRRMGLLTADWLLIE